MMRHTQSGGNGCLIAPEVFEPVRRQLGVPDRVLDVLVAEPCLQRPRIVPGIGQGVAAGVPQHVREDGEGHTGAPTEALEQRAEALGRHWATALTGEHIRRCLLLTLQAPQGANFVALHWMHRGGALFAPTDVQPAGVDLDLVPLQIAQLGSSKPVAVGQQDHGIHHAQVTTNGVPRTSLALVMVEAVGGRRYLLYSQRRLLMWKQAYKTPLREVTINYFKWP